MTGPRSHNCSPPSVTAERWECLGCGATWVAHGHGWRRVPPFVPMAPADGEVEVDDWAAGTRM